jgi:hypothetical protein
VNQLNSKLESKNEPFEYANMKVMVAKLIDDQMKFVDGAYEQFYAVQLELEGLPSGQYIVFCKPTWQHYHHCRNIV